MGKPTFDSWNFEPGLVSRETGPGLGFLAITKKVSYPEYIGVKKRTRGTETSKYPEERTSTETPLVVASERGLGQCACKDNWNRLESRALVGDSPVQVMPSMRFE